MFEATPNFVQKSLFDHIIENKKNKIKNKKQASPQENFGDSWTFVSYVIKFTVFCLKWMSV